MTDLVAELAFTVHGIPVTAGSHRAFVINGRARIVPADKKQRPWQEAVRWAAIEADCKPLEGPLTVLLRFLMPKPQSAPKRRLYPTGARSGDVDKLARAALDPLHGICFHDDAQVVSLLVTKRYVDPGDITGCEVQIWPLEEA